MTVSLLGIMQVEPLKPADQRSIRFTAAPSAVHAAFTAVAVWHARYLHRPIDGTGGRTRCTPHARHES